MTKLTLEQLKTDSRYTKTTNPWYKVYPYRLTIPGSYTWWERAQSNTSSMNEWKRSVELNASIRRWCERKNTLENKHYKTRSGYTLNVYCKTIEDVEDFLIDWDENVVEISAPVSEQHETALFDDTNTKIRENLYYKKYRYRLRSWKRRGDMDVWIEMVDFIHENFDSDSYFMNKLLRDSKRNVELYNQLSGKSGFVSALGRVHRYLPYAGDATVYFENYDDMVTFRMTFMSDITDVVKVVTTDELG